MDKCLVCGCVFYLPQPSSEELQRLYSGKHYRDQYTAGTLAGSDYARYRYGQLMQNLEKYFRDRLPPRGRRHMLDLGCGDGDLLKVAAENGWRVSGSEIAEFELTAAGRKVPVYVGDVAALTLPEDTFDLVTAYHVIEHLPAPMRLLEIASRALKPGGILLVETPNINGLGALVRGSNWSMINPPYHLVYFNPRSLESALGRAGFTRVGSTTVLPPRIYGVEGISRPLRPVVGWLYRLGRGLGLGPNVQSFGIKGD